jgi:hypothetical protein
MIWISEMVSYIYTVKPRVHEPNASYHLLLYTLREDNRSGWLDATGGYRKGVDKADFHAIGAIEGD